MPHCVNRLSILAAGIVALTLLPAGCNRQQGLEKADPSGPAQPASQIAGGGGAPEVADAAASLSPLQAGDQAPEFALVDQTGATRALTDLHRSGPVAIVFFRSARW